MADECGRCTVQGKCCSYLELQLARPMSGDQQRWAELHEGVSIIERDGGTFVRLNIPCSALNHENGCDLYGTSKRPRLCGSWPGLEPLKMGAPEGCVFVLDFLDKIV